MERLINRIDSAIQRIGTSIFIEIYNDAFQHPL